MDLKVLFIATLSGVICCSCALKDENDCIKANAKSCGECIQVGEKCWWCTDPDFLKQGETTSARCNELELLKKKGCHVTLIENPCGSQTINKNIPLTKHNGENGAENRAEKLNPEDIIQVQPQMLTLDLRPGEAQSFNLNFKRARDYPIDLYYLMDLSLSMKDDLENIKNLGTSLMTEMSKFTSDFRIGLGFFLKRTVTPAKGLNPCIGDKDCTSPFSYKNVLKLTSDGKQFNTLVGQQQISGNLDSPESSFDAIMQVAVCGEEIGWRNVTRVLVISTDASFYFTGDGKPSRTLQPNDGECHLENNMYTMSHYYDYPYITQLVQKLSDNNIQTIFAVTAEFHTDYKELTNLIPKSAVGTLSADSSNIINLISDAYNSLSSEVILENSKLPKGVTITYQSRCKNGQVGEGDNGRKCSDISIGEEVSFKISIQAHKCPNQGQSEIIKIKPLGITEEVEIFLHFMCECSCQAYGEDSPTCANGNGTFECGACRCNFGGIGRRVQCECCTYEVDSDNLDAYCQRDGGDEICSNNGDCVCGSCECKKRENPDERYSGQFCECDNFNCDRSNNKLCGGHGHCDCRVCVCDANYTGNACDCSLDTSACLASNKQICNGRGICECGTCKCTDPTFQGPTCEICPTCPGVCTVHKACVQCRAFGTGDKKDTCEKECSDFNLIMVKDRNKLPEPKQGVFPLMHCKERDANDCWFFYTFSFNDKTEKEVHVVETLSGC